MTTTRTPAPRRRPRRGSLERPVNGRLYRASFAVAALPLLLLAFSSARPGLLSQPQLPPNFDGAGAKALATEIATSFPDRSPGSAGALGAARWLHDQLASFGLPVTTDRWRERVPGGSVVSLENIWAVARGESADAIVVMAHRDDSGVGPGADDNASGTAALVELARGYTQTAAAAGRVKPAHTLVFLSTDGADFGGLGATRFAGGLPYKVVAVVNLTAVAGTGPPRLVISGDTPRTANALLVATADRRIAEQTGRQPKRASLLAQLIDLGFPFTLHEQGPLVARGVPAVTLTTGGERAPAAFGDNPKTLDGARLTTLGRAAQELVGSLDQGIELTGGTPSFVWIGGRVVRGWAIELLLFSLLVPFLVGVVDLFAHCRRRHIPIAPALRSLRSRIAFWAFAGLAFVAFGALGAWPKGPARPPNPASTAAGDWAVLPLLALGVVLLVGWLVGRQRLVPRRPVGPDEELAGDTAALLGLALVSLLVLATDPFALLFCLPAVHAWLWLPQIRSRNWTARFALLALGLTGPLLILFSLGIRYGLGFDAPWYLLELVSLRYVGLTAFAITLAGTACAAQLVAVAARRYAPYPGAGERPARGPLRQIVRASARAARRRRQVVDSRRALRARGS